MSRRASNRRKVLSSIFMFLTIWVPNFGWGIRFRGWLISRLMKSPGERLKLSALVNIYNPSRLSIGNDVYIGYGTYIGDGDIRLDDEVVIGPMCSITGGNHLFKGGSVRFGGYEYAPVKIGRGSWLGAHVCVLSGVTIGSGCTVAAGAVVTEDIPDGVIAGGIPARVLKENDPDSGVSGGVQDGMVAAP